MWVDRKSDPLLWLWTLTTPVTLTLDFQGQIMKKGYNKMVDWHGTKGMGVDRMLNPPCDLELWSWPWTFKVKLGNRCIPTMGGPIDMKQRGSDLIGCWIHDVTLTLNLNYDLGLGFSRSNKHIWGMGGSVDLEQKRRESDTLWLTMQPCGTWKRAFPWATVHTKYTAQVIGWCRTVTVFNLWAHLWTVHSLIYGLRGVVVIWTMCLYFFFITFSWN